MHPPLQPFKIIHYIVQIIFQQYTVAEQCDDNASRHLAAFPSIERINRRCSCSVQSRRGLRQNGIVSSIACASGPASTMFGSRKSIAFIALKITRGAKAGQSAGAGDGRRDMPACRGAGKHGAGKCLIVGNRVDERRVAIKIVGQEFDVRQQRISMTALLLIVLKNSLASPTRL